MITPQKCPFCGVQVAFPGEFVIAPEGGMLFFSLSREVVDHDFWRVFLSRDGGRTTHVLPAATICYSCGMVWAACNPKELKISHAYIERFGPPELKAQLAALDTSAPP